jgi:hypothetical protein
MDALFGVERAKKLRARLRQSQLRLLDREGAILKEIADAFREKGGRFFLPFRLWMEDQRRISHHLLFVSKNFRGYPLMKEIMAPESSSAPQGVPSFEYNPRDYSMLPSFELYQPLDELEKRLLADLGGRTLTMNQIYERYSVNKPFTKKKLQASPAGPVRAWGYRGAAENPSQAPSPTASRSVFLPTPHNQEGFAAGRGKTRGQAPISESDYPVFYLQI